MWKSTQNDATKKTRWARKLALPVVLVITGGALLFFAIKSQSQYKTVTIKNIAVHAQLAQTSEEKQRGLCCRDSLPENSGMLFVYSQPGNYRFWMKDTRIPLDMYWINRQRKIVHIEHSVQPDSYPKRFSSPVPAQYILETNAGFAKKHHIQVGDVADF